MHNHTRLFCRLFTLFSILTAMSACGDDEPPEPEPCLFSNIPTASLSITENSSPATSLGTLDVQSTSGPVSYRIITGNSENTWSVDETSGELLLTGSVDYEKTNQYVLGVTVRADCGSETFNVTINVTNEVEPFVDRSFQGINKIENISYGPNGDDQVMHVYEPQGGGQAPRPLIVFAGGGAFNPSNLDVLNEIGTRFAQAGYVIATIRYISDPNNSLSPFERNITAIQDIRAAIRFFRKDAATDNNYNIDPNNVFIGGHGTGAFIALGTSFVDETDLSAEELSALESLGGLEGDRGNPGYSSDFKLVAAFSGAVFFLDYIDTGENPVVALHGTNDDDVPCGIENLGAINSYGSCEFIPKAQEVGINAKLVLESGGNHQSPQYCQDCFVDVLEFMANYVE